jgi:2-polyprenyl-6-methoxyphenol hydroxylase-like FAD-dependent oxidoreductase
MLMDNKIIAIIGGGPGGLTLARLLQLKGVDVKVYERDKNADARVQGATLDLHHGSGLKAIEAMGLIDVFKSTYRPGAEVGRVVDKNGVIVYDGHVEVPADNFASEEFRPEIDRSDLRAILLDSLTPGSVVWNSQFTTMTPMGSGWKLEFKNGTSTYADIVIGADGANSRIRPYITNIKPLYAGITILQGNVEAAKQCIPNIYDLLKGGKIYVYGDSKYIHISSKGDGSIDFYISSLRDESWAKAIGTNFLDRARLILWAENEFKGWNSIWFELFEHVALPILIRPQYFLPLDQSWNAKPNLTLLGDAAHIMPPSGEGVNLAMLDALEMSNFLTNPAFKVTQSAIAAYELQMRIRAAAESKDSFDMAKWMHSETALERMVQMLS